MKDRLSVHIDNGQAETREAVTILRNGGQVSQSGLVGITNASYAEGEQPTLPVTIFNVQATGDSNVRFSSGPDSKSTVQLLGNGNSKASGVTLIYDPSVDNASVAEDLLGNIYVVPSADSVVAEFSLIRPSGEGVEFSHISFSQRGFVGVGLNRTNDIKFFTPNAPLTVAYASGNVPDSGTISMHQQADSPETDSNFGKIYVKPFDVDGRSQALFFKDDNGIETNLVLSEELDSSISTDGLIFGHNGNTYGGWYTPEVRNQDNDKSDNTYYGWGAGYGLEEVGVATANTIVGHHTGSGMNPPSRYNTIVGSDSLKGYKYCQRNIVIGDNNLSSGVGSFGGMDDSILIGRELYQSEMPADGTLAIGFGSHPVIVGKLTGTKSVTVSDATFSLLDTSNSELKFSVSADTPNSRYTNVVDTIDFDKTGSEPAANNLEFTFTNADSLSKTLLTLDPSGESLSNSPTYEAPTVPTPFAQLDADLKLRGAIRFQDGTSLSGLAEYNFMPLNGVSGVGVKVVGSQNYFKLDYSSLDLAGNLSDNIRTDNTYVALQLDGDSSENIGKVSLQGLTDFLYSGVASVAENCNILVSNPENELNVNTSALSRSVMLGCDVAYGASGWKNSVIIGTEAGANATVSNPTLGIDTASIFLGYRAGYDCDSVENTIAIGTNAAKNADGATDSVFIGSNAGLDCNFDNSIGIGENALRGSGDVGNGSGNIEIVAGLLDNQRLLYGQNVSDKLNIQNTIAGDTADRMVSIGDVNLNPDAVLSVRKDNLIGGHAGTDYIQSWWCNDVRVAAIDCEGNFVTSPSGTVEVVEGICDAISAPASPSIPTSGLMIVKDSSWSNNGTVYVVNRDPTLTIPTNAYVIAREINGTYRPTWVSCTGV